MNNKRISAMSHKMDQLHILSNQELEELQQILLKSLSDIMKVCKKYNIEPMLGGGSALGLVRHDGFIPWDDDIDLIISRKDYNKLIKVFEEELNDKYYFLAPNYKKGSNCYLARIYRKGTTLVSMLNAGAPYPNCIYIDISPIDFAPSKLIIQIIKGAISNTLKVISYSVYWYKYQNKYFRNYMRGSKSAWRYYNFRLFIGKMFSFYSHEKWFGLFDKFIQDKESDYATIASGRKHYNGELLRKNVFFPPQKALFSGIEVYIPNNINEYLENLYGDYMKIPPLEKREKHLCVIFDACKEIKEN